ncbi:MAG: NADH-quinone oxidoreductase subunit M [bacterium]
MNIPILTLLTFSPMIGALVIMFINKKEEFVIKAAAIGTSIITMALAVTCYFNFDQMKGTFQLADFFPWIPQLGINYHLGIDGISLPLILLTVILTVVSLLYSWNTKDRVKEYFVLFLLLETGMLGVFTSLDFFLFYFFWEISLVPMYFIIGIWGGPRKEYAAIKFFLYTLVGSVAMLLAILGLYFGSNPHTFSMVELGKQMPYASDILRSSLIFIGLFVGFAIKVPMFPFHTWLPDAHVEAPTAGSIILAGVLLKMGAYGFLRIMIPILPQASQRFAIYIAIIALISIIYGAFVAMAQWDLKKLIAYSSVSHMGYVMLGIAAAMAASGASITAKTTALTGASLQMFNHGIITGALFLLVGVIYERTHSRDLASFGGLGVTIPVFTGVFTLSAFASLGLPGLAGFVAEFFVFVGAFPIYPILTGLALIGVVITAAFFLWTIERMFLGKLNEKWANVPDINWLELLSFAPLGILMLVIGLYPALLTDIMQATLMGLFK